MKQFYCDGSLGSFRAGAAAIPISTSKMKTSYVANLEFQCINNIAKYEAILLGSYLHGSCLDHHGMKLNIMLQPLIEELKELWKGIEAYDVFKRQKFNLRVTTTWLPKIQAYFQPSIFDGRVPPKISLLSPKITYF
jgi:hypothetical protein